MDNELQKGLYTPPAYQALNTEYLQIVNDGAFSIGSDSDLDNVSIGTDSSGLLSEFDRFDAEMVYEAVSIVPDFMQSHALRQPVDQWKFALSDIEPKTADSKGLFSPGDDQASDPEQLKPIQEAFANLIGHCDLQEKVAFLEVIQAHPNPRLVVDYLLAPEREAGYREVDLESGNGAFFLFGYREAPIYQLLELNSGGGALTETLKQLLLHFERQGVPISIPGCQNATAFNQEQYRSYQSDRNKLTNCSGIHKDTHGNIAIGHFDENGELDGVGMVLNKAKGSYLSGVFKAGALHGQGVYKDAHHRFYGIYINGQANCEKGLFAPLLGEMATVGPVVNGQMQSKDAQEVRLKNTAQDSLTDTDEQAPIAQANTNMVELTEIGAYVDGTKNLSLELVEQLNQWLKQKREVPEVEQVLNRAERLYHTLAQSGFDTGKLSCLVNFKLHLDTDDLPYMQKSTRDYLHSSMDQILSELSRFSSGDLDRKTFAESMAGLAEIFSPMLLTALPEKPNKRITAEIPLPRHLQHYLTIKRLDKTARSSLIPWGEDAGVRFERLHSGQYKANHQILALPDGSFKGIRLTRTGFAPKWTYKNGRFNEMEQTPSDLASEYQKPQVAQMSEMQKQKVDAKGGGGKSPKVIGSKLS